MAVSTASQPLTHYLDPVHARRRDLPASGSLVSAAVLFRTGLLCSEGAEEAEGGPEQARAKRGLVQKSNWNAMVRMWFVASPAAPMSTSWNVYSICVLAAWPW